MPRIVRPAIPCESTAGSRPLDPERRFCCAHCRLLQAEHSSSPPMSRYLGVPRGEPLFLARTFLSSGPSLGKASTSMTGKYSRIGPGMFEPFDQLPHGPIEGSRHAGLLSPFHDRAVHEVDLGLPPGEHVLQHAGIVLARGACPPFHQRARVVMKFDS